jgi:MSHA biogenesis protein MshJ
MIASIRDTFDRLAVALDGKAPRERIAVLAAVTAVVIGVGYGLVIAPQSARQAQLAQQLETRRAEVANLRAHEEELKTRIAQTHDAAQRITDLREALRARDPVLADAARAVVSPQEMTRMVEEVLTRNRALEVLGIENLPKTAAANAETASAEATAAPAEGAGADTGGIHRHAMRVTVRGRYADITRYLRELESLPWRPFWAGMTLDTEKYPVARATITLYTLSFDEKWIGI